MKTIILTLFIITISFGYNVYCPCESTQYFDTFEKKCKEKTGNCFSYDLNATNDAFVCDSCEENFKYIVSFNTCEAITIPHCIRANINDGVETCGTCKPNFYKSQDSLSCIAYPTDNSTQGYNENCTKYELYGSTLQCKECSGDFYPDAGDCVAFPTSGHDDYIQDCIKYTKRGAIAICSQCNADYSFGVRTGSSVCQTMENVITNCVKARNDNASQCEECKTGYMIKTSDTTCTKIPTVQADPGYLENCSTYKYVGSEIKCDKCKVGFVHKDNLCEQVPSGNLVTDCVEYEYDSDTTSYTCTDCKESYWSGGNDYNFSACEQCPAAPVDPNAPAPGPNPSGSNIIKFGGLILILVYIIL